MLGRRPNACRPYPDRPTGQNRAVRHAADTVSRGFVPRALAAAAVGFSIVGAAAVFLQDRQRHAGRGFEQLGPGIDMVFIWIVVLPPLGWLLLRIVAVRPAWAVAFVGPACPAADSRRVRPTWRVEPYRVGIRTTGRLGVRTGPCLGAAGSRRARSRPPVRNHPGEPRWRRDGGPVRPVGGLRSRRRFSALARCDRWHRKAPRTGCLAPGRCAPDRKAA